MKIKEKIKNLYNYLWCKKYNFWLWYWYKRTRCPVCHEKIRWKLEYESVWDNTGYSVPYHLNEAKNDADNRDEYCEGVC